MLVCPFCRLILGDDETTCPRDGHEGASTPDVSLPSSLQGRFSVVQPFAKGETGALFLADDTDTGRRGILKVVELPDKATSAERSRMGRELSKQATLDPSVLAVPTASGTAGEQPWLFREWHEGVSLKVRLERDGALPVTEALAIAAQIASALDELHRAGLLHRDLQPGHIIVNPRPSGVPSVAVIDAGVAGRVDVGTVFDIVGTAAYLSPEQAKGKLVSFRSDLYALGCVLYEMLVGSPPFSGDDAALVEAHATQDAPTPSVSMPSGMAQLLGKLLAKEPRERPFSAQQVRRALEPFLPDEAKGSKREATQTFETHEKEERRQRSAGTGTLRPNPRKAPQATIMGMPAAQPKAKTSVPPPPPGSPERNQPRPEHTEELSAVDLEQAEEIAAKTGGAAPRPDQTEELSALDLEQAEEVVKRAPRVKKTLFGMPAARTGSVPPPTPGAASSPGAQPAGDSSGPSKSAPAAIPPKPSSATPSSPGTLSPSPNAPASIPKAPSAAKPASLPPPPPPSRPDAPIPAQAQAPTPTAAAPAPTASEAPAPAPAAAPPWESAPAASAPAESAPGADTGGLDYDDLAETTAFDPETGMTTGGGYLAPTDQPVAAHQAFPAASAPAQPMHPQAAHPQAAAAAPYPQQPAPQAVASDKVAGMRSLPIIALGAIVALCFVGSLGGGIFLWLGSSDDGDEVASVANTAPRPQPVAQPAPAPAPAQPVAVAAPEPAVEPAPEPEPVEEPVVESEPEPEAAAERDPEPERTARSGSSDDEGSSSRRGRTQERPAASGGGANRAERFHALRQQALAHFRARRFGQAAESYEQATQLNPRHAGVYAGLGAARLAQGRHRQAINAYRQAIRLQPRTAGFHSALGAAYQQSGDRNRARQSYQRALALDPNNQAARRGLAALGG